MAGLLAAVLLCSCACFVFGRRTARPAGGAAKSDAADAPAKGRTVKFSLRRYEKHKDEQP